MNNVSEDNKVRTWKPNELPASKDFAHLDHHHNMVRRLQLLPFSARGNQIKKNVAYLYLQHILVTGLEEEEIRLSLYPRCVVRVENRFPAINETDQQACCWFINSH